MARPIISIDKIVEKLFKTHGNNISILKYYSASVDALFKCSICEHEWWAKPSKVSTKTGCPNCKIINNRLSQEDVLKYILFNNCKWIDGEYLTSKSKLKILFECGHSEWIIYNSFQQGSRCLSCGKKKRADLHRTKEHDVIAFLNEYDLKVLEFPNGITSQKTSVVRYSCRKGHVTERTIDRTFQNPTCHECKLIYLSEIRRGYSGGSTSISAFLRNNMNDWKYKSMIDCNFKCAISGEKFDDVHHLYSFSTIVYETMTELGLDCFLDFSEYSEKEISIILNKFLEIHNRYPLGVCLTSEIHALFHNIYGSKNNVPDQFYKFSKNIKQGKLKINQ